MRRFLVCLSALLLAAGWVWAQETKDTLATSPEASSASVAHGKKETTGQAMSSTKQKKHRTVVKRSKESKPSQPSQQQSKSRRKKR